MKITDILAAGPSYSFEFFPPKTPEAAENLPRRSPSSSRSRRRSRRSPTARVAARGR